MRGFKYISIFALFLWTLAVMSAVWLASTQTVIKDAVFQQQLSKIEDVVGAQRIFIYGSSGVLLGMSAESIELKTGHPSRNLSTARLGGQFDLAVASILGKTRKGDIIIISDRNFRQSRLKSQQDDDLFGKIYKAFSFIPNLKRFLEAPFTRTSFGDLVSYPSADVAMKKYDLNPLYGRANLELISVQINLIKQYGACPVIVLTPLLVKAIDYDAYERATRQLLASAASSGLSAHLAQSLAIEIDESLFTDQFHLSAKGRDKWTKAIGKELIERHMCNIGFDGQ